MLRKACCKTLALESMLVKGEWFKFGILADAAEHHDADGLDVAHQALHPLHQQRARLKEREGASSYRWTIQPVRRDGAADSARAHRLARRSRNIGRPPSGDDDEMMNKWIFKWSLPHSIQY